MAGVSYQLDISGLDGVAQRLRGLSRYDLANVAFDIGALLESSTKERIDTEKRSADGTPWPAWSDDYGRERKPHHSLLMNEGDLLDSIQSFTTGDEIRVGTPLVYGAIHQFGGEAVGKNIPARAFLGLSDDDEDEISALIVGDIREIME